MKTFVLAIAALISVQAHANMGGHNYNVGSFACADDNKELTSTFTFGRPTKATLVIKGQEVELECYSAAEADTSVSILFSSLYSRPSDICEGSYAKGNVVAAITNSMGNVQMHARLVDKSRRVTASTTMNCESAPKNRGSGW
jgi:hypothetical protein